MRTIVADLDSDRLYLRSLRAEDAPRIAELVNDWDLARYTANIPHPYSEQMAIEFIAAHSSDADHIPQVFAIIRKAGDELIGCVGLTKTPNNGGAEIGYWVGQRYWGNGYATEAIRRVVDYAFGHLRLPVLEATVVPVNKASHRVLAKVGFLATDVREEFAPARGHPFQVIVRQLTRDAWESGIRTALPIMTVVAVVLVDPDGRILLAQRPAGKMMAGLWEFPGGKIKEGESPEDALIRELREELSIDVKASCLAPLTFASHRYEKFHLLMPLYVCRRWNGSVKALEHQNIAWVRPEKLRDYPMPPADEPLIAAIQDLL